ncbi:MAG: cytochrome C oxidase subunit IV family protein [Planctomycetota bacterium]
MAHETHAAGEVAHDDSHEMSLLTIGGYLLALTIATSATLLVQGTGFWTVMTNILFVLMISTAKAALVVGFFMHLKFEKGWKYVVCVPPCILGVALIFALLPDVAFKCWPVTFQPY